MTIQAFAKLCGCNPQTLRYYDKVGLLRPSRVDRFTGYRYYDEDQALTFVKIKNLQLGGFSIEEIKPLLMANDDEVYRAFETTITPPPPPPPPEREPPPPPPPTTSMSTIAGSDRTNVPSDRNLWMA